MLTIKLQNNVSIEIKKDNKIIFNITYIFKDGTIKCEFGQAPNLDNRELAIKLLNILASIKEMLEQQINRLGISLRAIKNDTESYYS